MPNNTDNQNIANVLSVPGPLAGQNLNVDMVPGSAVQLPFEPGEASVSRSGNDLTFELDDGGSVTISDFFVSADGELPLLILPGGEQVPAALAFADSDMDISTAAGPGNPPGSGAGDYSDDPGSLLGGVDRLGMTDPFFWGRGSELDREDQGLEQPGGNFNLDDESDLGGLVGIVGGAFEDGLPFQYLGDYNTFVPCQLVFTFEPTGTTVVDAIRLSGFPAGTVIYLGDPNDPDTETITITGPDQVLNFSEQDFTDGVYFVPPKNSDKDFDLSVEVDIRAESSGLTGTITGSGRVTVDAVADMPELEGYGATSDSSSHQVTHEADKYEYDQGTNKVENSAQEGKTSGGATVSVTVKATFDDYEDGSESHFMLVESHPGLALDPSSVPPGFTYLGTVEIDGVTYHRFEVSNEYIADHGGTVELPITFKTTDKAGEKNGQDEKYDLKVGAYAEEEASDREIDLSNNRAEIITEDGKGVSASVDVVNRGLSVEVGWASEGNDNSKHKHGSYNPTDEDFENMDDGAGVSRDSTGKDGAPIRIGLSGDHDGSQEYITEVELKFDEGRGQLCVNGQPVEDGMEIPGANGVTYRFSVDADGKVTIEVDGKVDNLNELGLTFRPNPGYDDTDVGMSYNVKVENGSGAKAEFGGNTEIVIDAVADMATGLGGTADYGTHEDGSKRDAAAPGDTVEITFKVTFPDRDGSEEHRVFIRVDGNNGSAKHDYNTISDKRLADLNKLGAGLAEGGDYLELPIPHPSVLDKNGDYFDPDTGLTVHYENGTYTYDGLDVSVETNPDGSYSIKGVEVELPGEDILKNDEKSDGELDPDTGDTSMDFGITGWAKEKGGEAKSSEANNEHDAGNNNAFSNGNAKVEIATPGGKTGDFDISGAGGKGYENNEPKNNLPGTDNQDIDGNDNTAAAGVDISFSWSFADKNEIVTEVVIKVPLDRYGNPLGEIEYEGVVYKADAQGNITIPIDPDSPQAKNGFGEGDLTFIPQGNASGSFKLDASATVKDLDSGKTGQVEITTPENRIEVDLDAVANRSGEVSGEGNYGKGKEAFAPEEGESIGLSIKSSFDDNDGSEQHFLLVEQKPHWEGEFETGNYDLNNSGDTKTYFKIPVPTAPKDGGNTDSTDPHQLTNDEWAALQKHGSITVERGGYKITIELEQARDENGELVSDDQGNPVYDPSRPWQVEAEFDLTPPKLAEGSESLGTGSLVEERDINQGSEDRDANNNTAMRPGEDLKFEVDYTEGIKVETGFVYENGEQYEGPAYKDAEGNVIDPGFKQDGRISVSPSGQGDSFFGDLEVSIPADQGQLYFKNADGNMQLLDPDNVDGYAYTTPDGVQGVLKAVVVDGQLKVTFTPKEPGARYNGIDLEVRTDGSYSDKDIEVLVKGNLYNERSGQESSGVSGGGKVMNDAVAQSPDEVGNKVDEQKNTADATQGTGAKVTLSAEFPDAADGSEGHYFLLEAKPGFTYTFEVNGKSHTIDVTEDWPTVIGPDGTVYFKIPANPDKNGKASLDVEVKVAEDGHETIRKNGETEEAGFKYGSMTEEERLSDNGEKTYDNNISINDGNQFEIGVDLGEGGGWRPVDVGEAYENNTPNAHLGGEAGSVKEYPEVTFDLPADADGVWLRPGERGTLVDADGKPLTEFGPNQDGWYYIPRGQAGGVHFKVDEDFKDDDVPLEWKIEGGSKDGTSGEFEVIVDAVAQPGQVGEVTVETGLDPDGQPYSHSDSGEIKLKVELSGLLDQDENTEYHVLVEAQPGWECPGAELVIIDGKSYFKVPVDPKDIKEDGTATVEVALKNPGGDTGQKLEIGVSVQDRPSDNGESRMDNNHSASFKEDKVEIKTSVAEACLKLEVSEGYEDNLDGWASIKVSNVGDNDVVEELHFSVKSDEGVFTWGTGEERQILEDGNVIEDGNFVVRVTEEGGKLKVSISTKDGSGLTEDDIADYVNNNLGFGTAGGNHSSKDIDIEWGYTVRDTQSGDKAGHEGGQKVVIDAVAHEPKVTDYEVDYGDGRAAARPGESVTVKGKVEFTSIKDETNFVLVQFAPGWAITGVTLTGPNGEKIYYSPDDLAEMELFYPDGTGSGGAYYKLPLEKDGVSIKPEAGAQEGDKYEVGVEVGVKTPQSGIDGDTSGNVGIGGAAVDKYDDGETKLSNNVASDTGSGDGVKLGLADSTSIEGEQLGDAPKEGADEPIKFDIRPEGGAGDVITGLTLTNTAANPEDTGYFWYNNQRLEYGAGGKVTLPPAGAPEDWVFDPDLLEFRPEPSFGGDLTIKIEGSVKDAGSGDAKDGLKGEMSVHVDPVATAPTELKAEGAFNENGDVWTLTLSAKFADTDGSEEHFFMFRVPEGLSLTGEYPGLEGPVAGPDGSPGWYKLPVSPKEAEPSLELEFQADSSWDGSSGVEYNAGAREKATGETDWGTEPGQEASASPAADGGFDYRTEHVDGLGDFSGSSDDLIIHGGDGDDTIHGGLGHSIIYGGEGNDTIYAGDGGSLIIGGAGNDVMYGGSGQDIFVWDVEHFCQGQNALDLVNNFEYGTDSLHFSNVFDAGLDFSTESILEFLSDNKGGYADGVMSLEGESFSLQASFNENGVSLNISSGGSEQKIDIDFGNSIGNYTPPANADEAAQILNNLINQGLV